MKSLLTTLLLGTVIAVGGQAYAAAAPDPVIGTWTLNVAKSQFPPGLAPKSQTRTYAESAEGSTVLTFSGIAADGSPVSGQSTFNYDGKDYPMTGAPFYDTLSMTRVNATTARSVLKKGRKVVGSTIRTVSRHGKVLTLSTDLRDARGAKAKTVAVYDRQESQSR